MIGRLGGTLGLVYLSYFCGYRSGIDLKEQIFIWYAGMIRGAIAFGLVLRINKDEFDNKNVIVTTALMLVVFTTVVFGSTVGILQKFLFSAEKRPDSEEVKEDDDYKKLQKDY